MGLHLLEQVLKEAREDSLVREPRRRLHFSEQDRPNNNQEPYLILVQLIHRPILQLQLLEAVYLVVLKVQALELPQQLVVV